MPEEILILPRKAWVGTNFDLTSASGEALGTFSVRLVGPNTLEGPEFAFEFGQRGLAEPTFWARERGAAEEFARVQYDFLSGRMSLKLSDGRALPVAREGLLLPNVRIADSEGREILLAETRRLFGKEFAARLTPTDEWPLERLIGLLGLLFHVKVSLTVLFTAAGGSAAIAPI